MSKVAVFVIRLLKFIVSVGSTRSSDFMDTLSIFPVGISNIFASWANRKNTQDVPW